MDNLDKINYDEIKHYGIKGQKWGRRQYQNEDGSVTVPEVLRKYLGVDVIRKDM